MTRSQLTGTEKFAGTVDDSIVHATDRNINGSVAETAGSSIATDTLLNVTDCSIFAKQTIDKNK